MPEERYPHEVGRVYTSFLLIYLQLSKPQPQPQYNSIQPQLMLGLIWLWLFTPNHPHTIHKVSKGKILWSIFHVGIKKTDPFCQPCKPNVSIRMQVSQGKITIHLSSWNIRPDPLSQPYTLNLSIMMLNCVQFIIRYCSFFKYQKIRAENLNYWLKNPVDLLIFEMLAF